MNFDDVLIIGIGLSMDALAITVANCTSYGNNLTKKQSWSMPILFAIFQGLMPLIGYFVGSLFFSFIENYANIENYAKYFTSGIFFILAFKVIYDIIKDIISKEEENQKQQKFNVGLVVIQAFATSIDALIVGITLNTATLSVYVSCLVIALVTFVLVTIAMIFSKKLGALLGKYANYLSALILLVIAIKNLL